jgi:hypothetical protein
MGQLLGTPTVTATGTTPIPFSSGDALRGPYLGASPPILSFTTTTNSDLPTDMPGQFGQKVLKSFGLGDKDSKSQVSSSAELPGKGSVSINSDERVLSATHANNGTYPRLAKLSDGSILAAFTRHEGKVRVLHVSKSTDGGQSFFDWGEVSRSTGDLDNMYLLEVAPSKILAAFRNHDLGPGGAPTLFRITVCLSNDGGKSWIYWSQAAEKPAPLGLWEPFMRVGRRGEVQLTYSQEFAPDDQRTMRVVSHDQGHTWSKPVCVHSAGRFRDGMNGIAVTNDNGREAHVMVFETTRHGTFSVEAVVSYDDGASWHNRHEVYTPSSRHNAGAPQIASFADGSLAVAFMTDEDAMMVDWPNHAAVKVVFAGPPQNGKIQWTKPTLISKGSSYWPGIMALDQKTVFVTYESGGPRGKTICWNS